MLMWESERIELGDFEQPPGAYPRPDAPDVPDGPGLPDNVDQRAGGWYWVTMPDETIKKVQGRANLDALLEEIGHGG